MNGATTIVSESFGPHVPDVTAFGDADDHLRITALIASSVEARRSDNRNNNPAIAACLDAKTSWPDRCSALSEVLDAHCHDLTVGDFDALLPDRSEAESRWDDIHMTRQRDQLFRILLDAAARKPSWRLIRLTNSAAVSKALLDVGVSPSAQNAPADDVPSAVSPELRPAARWLVKRGLAHRDLRRLVEAAESPDDEIAAAVYDHLPFAARIAAMKLSAIRPASPLNGRIGPFEVSEVGVSRVIDPQSLALLIEAGVLVTFAPHWVQMPRCLRRYLRRWAQIEPSVELDAIHSWLAEHPAPDAASVTEAHYHAVCAGDTEAAFHTATYYSSDLRQLGYKLSRRKEWAEAASVYQRIVQEFDPTDAYAWEYLGWNLARKHGFGMSEAHAEQVEHAFAEAHRLEVDNPLFHGRLLGFRAERGADIIGEFTQSARRYEALYALDGLGWFARPVLRGLQRGRRSEAFAEIKARWGNRLRRIDRVREVLEPR